MRISNGRIQSSATHALEKLEVSKAEASRVSMVGNRSGGDNSASLRRGSNLLMDRVTFSRSYQRSSQSTSRYEVQTRSRVSSAPGESREIQEEKIIQNLVGAAFDAEVVVGQMRRGRMPGGEGAGTMPSTPGGEGRTVRGTALSMSQSRVTFQDEELQFQTQGSVLTEDGRSIEFSLNLTMDQTLLTREKQEQLLQFSQDQISLVDPLMVSLDGGVPQLSDTRFEFDLNNDGETEMVHFAAQGSGFLAFDRDQDGKINNGSELFGPGTGNGFGELATWDGDGNNWIDENDAVFDQLSVWVRDGQGEDRLIPLKEAGIGAISLDNTQTAFSHVDGENRQAGQLRQSGVFLFENGKAGLIQQVDLAAEEIVPPAVENLVPGQALEIPERRSPNEMVLEAFDLDPDSTAPLGKLKERLSSLRRELHETLKSRYGVNLGRKRDEARMSPFQNYDRSSPGLARFMLSS